MTRFIYLFNDFIEIESSVYNLGKSRNTEEHRGTQKTAVLHPTKLDEKNNPNYLVCKNNCVLLQHEL